MIACGESGLDANSITFVANLSEKTQNVSDAAR